MPQYQKWGWQYPIGEMLKDILGRVFNSKFARSALLHFSIPWCVYKKFAKKCIQSRKNILKYCRR